MVVGFSRPHLYGNKPAKSVINEKARDKEVFVK